MAHEEKEFSWPPDGDMDAAGRAFAFALDDTTVSDWNFEGLQDTYTTDEDSDEWDFEWPADIVDAPETTDTAPELPWAPEIPTLVLDDTSVSDGNSEWLQDTIDGNNDEWDFEWPEDIADAPEPEPPSTPEQPTKAILRLISEDSTTKEVLDIAIRPQALWATDGGLQQPGAGALGCSGA